MLEIRSQGKREKDWWSVREPKPCSRIIHNNKEWNRSRKHLLLAFNHLFVHLVSVFIAPIRLPDNLPHWEKNMYNRARENGLICFHRANKCLICKLVYTMIVYTMKSDEKHNGDICIFFTLAENISFYSCDFWYLFYYNISILVVRDLSLICGNYDYSSSLRCIIKDIVGRTFRRL